MAIVVQPITPSLTKPYTWFCPSLHHSTHPPQVTAGLADIRGGVSAFEEGIQAARTDTLAPAAIGLAVSTARCSGIVVSGAWADASGQSIACTLAGNPVIHGRFVRLTRSATGHWACESSVAAPLLPVGCALGS